MGFLRKLLFVVATTILMGVIYTVVVGASFGLMALNETDKIGGWGVLGLCAVLGFIAPLGIMHSCNIAMGINLLLLPKYKPLLMSEFPAPFLLSVIINILIALLSIVSSWIAYSNGNDISIISPICITGLAIWVGICINDVIISGMEYYKSRF